MVVDLRLSLPPHVLSRGPCYHHNWLSKTHVSLTLTLYKWTKNQFDNSFAARLVATAITDARLIYEASTVNCKV